MAEKHVSARFVRADAKRLREQFKGEAFAFLAQLETVAMDGEHLPEEYSAIRQSVLELEDLLERLMQASNTQQILEASEPYIPLVLTHAWALYEKKEREAHETISKQPTSRAKRAKPAVQ